MNIGITGCTSGPGSRLAMKLSKEGHNVTCLIRPASNIDNLKGSRINFIYGDITDPASLYDFIKGLDLCYHIAAQVNNATKAQYYNTNATGTKNICESIHKYNKNCKLIYCSTIAIFRLKWYNKFIYSHYTNSKYKAEKIVNYYMKNHNQQTTIIYPGYIYGPGDKNFIPSVVYILKKGLKFLVRGGEKNFPIIHIDDLCELFYRAGINKNTTNNRYIGVNRDSIGVHTLLKIIGNKLNLPVPTKIYPRLPLVLATVIIEKTYQLLRLRSEPPLTMRIIGFLSFNFVPTSNNHGADLNWEPTTSIEEGLDKTLLHLP